MQLEATQEPIKYRLKTGEEVVLRPGVPIEVPDPAATQLLRKAPDKVRMVNFLPRIESMQVGCWVEWRSSALPQQRGEVLAVHQDGTFEVFHPLTETLCRLPRRWVTRILQVPYVQH